MSPRRQGPELRDWDLDAVPTELVAAALGGDAGSIASQRAAASCVAAVTDVIAPPDATDAREARGSIAESVLAPADLQLDVRTDDWWGDLATLLLLGAPVTITVGPIPRKRHGWPRAYRDTMKSRAELLTRGWGESARVLRESADTPGEWPAVVPPATPVVAERTLERRGDEFDLTWHMPGLPPTGERVRVGRWRHYVVWQVAGLVSAVALPPVLSRCTVVASRLTPHRWVTTWTPDREVWPDV